MAFIKLKGVVGKVYVPDKEVQTERKHNCPECFACQLCADSRCHVCLQEGFQEAPSKRRAGHCCRRFQS